jgi:drug/metabolite transporter (DMT)-like permease
MSKKGWVLFGAMCLIWGVPYLLIRVAVREIDPPTLVFARTAPAALLLVPLAIRRRQLRPLLPRAGWIVVYSVVELAVPWLLLSRAEEHVSSSVAGLLIAGVPLISALLYRASGGAERLGGRRLAGLVIGFGGVAAVVGLDLAATDWSAVAMIGVCAVGYSVGPLIISRRLAALPGLGVVAASVALTALGYAPVALTHLPAHLSGEVIAAVAGLALVCTALAFVLFFRLIVEVGPVRSTVVTYVNPAVAVLLGVTLLSEPLTLGMLVGFPLIVVGSVLATRRSSAAEPLSPPLAVEPPAS